MPNYGGPQDSNYTFPFLAMGIFSSRISPFWIFYFLFWFLMPGLAIWMFYPSQTPFRPSNRPTIPPSEVCLCFCWFSVEAWSVIGIALQLYPVRTQVQKNLRTKMSGNTKWNKTNVCSERENQRKLCRATKKIWKIKVGPKKVVSKHVDRIKIQGHYVRPEKQKITKIMNP